MHKAQHCPLQNILRSSLWQPHSGSAAADLQMIKASTEISSGLLNASWFNAKCLPGPVQSLWSITNTLHPRPNCPNHCNSPLYCLLQILSTFPEYITFPGRLKYLAMSAWKSLHNNCKVVRICIHFKCLSRVLCCLMTTGLRKDINVWPYSFLCQQITRADITPQVNMGSRPSDCRRPL